mmetsp:Transcript_10267/g.16984  ORF Transcript_10267/g.16984 Transcript_10267/m.16984 type:complete len:96 (-) Transcript_10267:628-915(-)
MINPPPITASTINGKCNITKLSPHANFLCLNIRLAACNLVGIVGAHFQYVVVFGFMNLKRGVLITGKNEICEYSRPRCPNCFNSLTKVMLETAMK